MGDLLQNGLIGGEENRITEILHRSTELAGGFGDFSAKNQLTLQFNLHKLDASVGVNPRLVVVPNAQQRYRHRFCQLNDNAQRQRLLSTAQSELPNVIVIMCPDDAVHQLAQVR